MFYWWFSVNPAVIITLFSFSFFPFCSSFVLCDVKVNWAQICFNLCTYWVPMDLGHMHHASIVAMILFTFLEYLFTFVCFQGKWICCMDSCQWLRVKSCHYFHSSAKITFEKHQQPQQFYWTWRIQIKFWRRCFKRFVTPCKFIPQERFFS